VIAFLTIALSINSLLHWFLYSRLVGALGITSPTALWSLRLAAVLLTASYLLARIWEDKVSEAATYVMHWIASVWMGLMLELLWLCLVFFLVKIALVLTGVWGGFDGQTQTMIGRIAFFAVTAIALLLVGYGMYRATAPARIVHVQIPVKQITPELRNLKIVMAADFHTGVLVNRRQVRRMIDQISSLAPDLVIIPGDIVDRNAQRMMSLAQEFARLRAPRGVYGSTGNHEYYVGLGNSLEFCRAAGIRMLMNESVTLPEGLVIAGTEDRTARQFRRTLPTYEESMGPNAKTLPTIFLNHTPITRDAQAATQAGADLVVSGHTHGGQIFPFSLITRMVFEYHHGLYKAGSGHIFTTCGIGYWGPPMRIGVPPEIVVIHLIEKSEL
jgi:predicted MPP superfamily phosphohydrolase